MIERYENAEDAIPHESTVLVLSEVDQIFGSDYESIFAEVRDQVSCDKMVIEDHYRALDDLPDFEKLIQHSVWVVHQSCLLIDQEPALLNHLESGSVPDETQVVIAVDTEDDELASYLESEIDSAYDDSIVTVTDRSALVYFLVGHMTTASPCSPPGLQYVLSWNNNISDRIGRHQEFDGPN